MPELERMENLPIGRRHFRQLESGLAGQPIVGALSQADIIHEALFTHKISYLLRKSPHYVFGGGWQPLQSLEKISAFADYASEILQRQQHRGKRARHYRALFIGMSQ